ncbi:MAG: hypothetical protein U0893_18275 [Chloroflexota bacterium]
MSYGRRFGFLAAGALGALMVAGTWGFGGAQSVAAQASTRMTITLNEYQIISERASVPAGEVTFDVVNTGEENHELILFKSDKDVKSLPLTAAKDEVDEAQMGEQVGGWEDLEPAATASGTLILAPGKYILLCNLAKHYGAGMVGTLTVE